jgi:hypothetical protein
LTGVNKYVNIPLKEPNIMASEPNASSILLPPFDEHGVLPIGDYPLTIEQLRHSHLVTGEGNPSPTWDRVWRGRLVDNLELLIVQLGQIGITEIFVDGSFVENKDRPSDIDGYFECDKDAFLKGHIQEELNKIDPAGCWGWNDATRTWDPVTAKRQLPMWHEYHVELYAHWQGKQSGIRDRFGNMLQFPAAFRKRKHDNDRPKGIVKIVV